MKIILRTNVTPAAKAAAETAPEEARPKGMRTIIKAKAPAHASHADNLKLREEWLTRAASAIIAEMDPEATPHVRVSCGWAYGSRGTSERRQSETWMGKLAKDGSAQIFISPAVDDGAAAFILLAHELCHVVSGDAHHGAEFAKVALPLGFAHPLRDAVANSSLAKIANKFVEAAGDYPHSALSLRKDATPTGYRKDGTRQIKCICPKSGYVCRTTRKWLDLHGAPLSPVTKAPMTVCDEGGAE